MYKVINCKKLVKYQDGLSMQRNAFEKVKNKEYKGIFFILEHYPVYTIGTNGGWENLLFSKEYLESKEIDIVKTNRGGNITFHGPGQIVAYPILDLTNLKRDAHWYIDCLEEVVIGVLKEYGIEGSRKSNYRGVWIEDKKIAALGVSLKEWITTHGLSININVDKKYYTMINPCGITEFGVSSLEDYIKNVNIISVKQKLISSLENVFEIQLDGTEEAILERS